MKNDSLFRGYEQTKLVHYSENRAIGNDITVSFDELPRYAIDGVLKASRHIDGKLMQTYSSQGNHVGVIAATRLGKTTGYVNPTIISFAKQKEKKSMIISDPKGEVYRNTAKYLKEQGYRVILLNFRDYNHSESWNMLTPVYRLYHTMEDVEKSVTLVMTDNGPRNCFRGKIYENQKELEDDIERAKYFIEEEVSTQIDEIGTIFIDSAKLDDPYWEDTARELLKAFLWGMLEDSNAETRGRRPAVTEETFSFSTILKITNGFKSSDGPLFDDGGFFSTRSKKSRAYQLAKYAILENAPRTRNCVVATFVTKLAIVRDTATRIITRCNSFELSDLVKGPVAVFINYKDEIKANYKMISIFVQNAYKYLIEQANNSKDGKLAVPFYFILDEFGNFPAIRDFDATISACGGRNIFFILILQSYAQLDNVYGKDISTIIKDNLNVHVFFGSNNHDTLDAFKTECGLVTRLSPASALSGSKDEIEQYTMETIPLIPKSTLAHLDEGECVVTEANCGFVMWSRMERFYRCREMIFEQEETSLYKSDSNGFDRKYEYGV